MMSMKIFYGAPLFCDYTGSSTQRCKTERWRKIKWRGRFAQGLQR